MQEDSHSMLDASLDFPNESQSMSLLDMQLSSDGIFTQPSMEIAGTSMTLLNQDECTPSKRVVTPPTVLVTSKPRLHTTYPAPQKRSFLAGNLSEEAALPEAALSPRQRSVSPTSAQLLQRERIQESQPYQSPSQSPTRSSSPSRPATRRSPRGVQSLVEAASAPSLMYKPFIAPLELQAHGRPQSREVTKVQLKSRENVDDLARILNKPRGQHRAELLLKSLHKVRRIDRREGRQLTRDLTADREELLDLLSRSQPEVLGQVAAVPSTAQTPTTPGGLNFRPTRNPRSKDNVEPSDVSQALLDAKNGKKDTEVPLIDFILGDCADTPEKLRSQIEEIQVAHKPFVEELGGTTLPSYRMSDRVLKVLERKLELILMLMRSIELFTDALSEKDRVLDMVVLEEDVNASASEAAGEDDQPDENQMQQEGSHAESEGYDAKKVLTDFGLMVSRLVHKEPEGRPQHADRNANFKVFATTFGLPSDHELVLQAMALWDAEAKAWAQSAIEKIKAVRLEEWRRVAEVAEEEGFATDPDSTTAHAAVRLRALLRAMGHPNTKAEMDELWTIAIDMRAEAVSRYTQAEWDQDVEKGKAGESGTWGLEAADRVEENAKAALSFGVDRNHQHMATARQVVNKLRGTAVLRFAEQTFRLKGDALGAAEDAAKRIDKMIRSVVKKGCVYEQPEIQAARTLSKRAMEEERRRQKEDAQQKAHDARAKASAARREKKAAAEAAAAAAAALASEAEAAESDGED